MCEREKGKKILKKDENGESNEEKKGKIEKLEGKLERMSWNCCKTERVTING